MSRADDAVPTLARNSVPIRCAHASRELAVERFDVRDACGAVVGHRLTAERVEFGVGAAPQLRRGMADAARIDADQVESAQDVGVGQRRAHAGDGVDGRGARPARVDHEHADPVAGGRDADHRQLCLCAFGFGVIDGHRHCAALRGRDGSGVDGTDPPLAASPHRRLPVLLDRLAVRRSPGSRARDRRHQQGSRAAPFQTCPPATWRTCSHG